MNQPKPERAYNMEIIEDLEKVIEKYKKLQHSTWHDLRKNPNDLPKGREWVLAIFKESDSDFVLIPRVADYVGFATPATTKENWLIIDVENMSEYFYNLECIAWKYIEEFDIGYSITKPSEITSTTISNNGEMVTIKMNDIPTNVAYINENQNENTYYINDDSLYILTKEDIEDSERYRKQLGEERENEKKRLEKV